MHFKPDWALYLNDIRTIGITKAFHNVPKKTFKEALELGAGNGFQSSLLTIYCNLLVSTEINDERLEIKDIKNVNYQICDALKIKDFFEEKKFDLIYSSNMLEHITEQEKVLQGCMHCLKDDGIIIHTMPSVFWKICQLFFFYPNLFLNAIASIKRKILNKQRTPVKKNTKGNNFDIKNQKKTKWKEKFIPPIHGVSRTHLGEFMAFRKKHWISVFEKADFNIINIRKGAVASGYGFGLNKFRALIDKLGLTSEYIYIAEKKGCDTHFESYFTNS